MNILEEIKEEQIERLEKSRQKLIDFTLSGQFISLSLTINEFTEDQEIERIANDIPTKGRFIYYFSCSETPRVIDSYRNAKDSMDKRSRLNDHPISPYLYVGSSKSLRKRFKEHCGICNKATYALKLKNWIKDQPIHVEFHYCEIPTDDQEILQNLEDGLWLRLKPVFGKYGGKY